MKISAIGLALVIMLLGLTAPQVKAQDGKDSENQIQRMSYDDFLELVKKRRSIRQFKADPIPEDDIKKIVEAARWAPSGYNCQLWEFVVVRKPELKERIGDIVGTAFMEMMQGAAAPGSAPSSTRPIDQYKSFAKAPALILLLGDTRVKEYGPGRSDDERWLSIYLPSLSIAYQHMALAATSLGLASQWVSAVHLPTVPDQLRELIGIPEEMIFFDMFAVGYPAVEPSEKKMRPLDEMLHFDDCGVEDFRTKEEVAAYFAR